MPERKLRESVREKPIDLPQAKMQRAKENDSVERPGDAARFASLVRCSLEEAQDWLSRGSGTMETALDTYLAYQQQSKRKRTYADSTASSTAQFPCSNTLGAVTSCISLARGQETSRTVGHKQSENLPVKVVKAGAASSTAASTSKVLTIEIADDSESEGPSLPGATRACGRASSGGLRGFRAHFPWLRPIYS